MSMETSRVNQTVKIYKYLTKGIRIEKVPFNLEEIQITYDRQSTKNQSPRALLPCEKT